MFYAVVHGHKPGIYTSWHDVQRNLQNYPGACYKSFDTLLQAEDFITAHHEPIISRSVSSDTVHLQNCTAVYLEHYARHFACIILAQNVSHIKVYGPVPRGNTYVHRDFYTIYVVLSLMSDALHFYTRDDYVYKILTNKITNWEQTPYAMIIKAILALSIDRTIHYSFVSQSTRSIKHKESANLAQYAHQMQITKLQVWANDKFLF